MSMEEIKEFIDELINASAEFQRAIDLNLGCSFACFQSEECAKNELIEAIDKYITTNTYRKNNG